MATRQHRQDADPARDGEQRRRLVLLAGAAAVLGFLHFVDHVIRGQLVTARGLNPDWNHSGWPFNPASNPESFILPASFVVVFGILLPGILFTRRGKLGAGYWLGASLFLTALLAFVHFVGGAPGKAETPNVIAMSHSSSVGSVLALIDLFGLFVVLAALAVQAVLTRQRSGHW